jgi:hypothetical protein
MPEYYIVGGIFVLLAYFALVLLRNRVQIPRLLNGWAADNGFTIVTWEYRKLFVGPFLLSNSRAREICYVTVRDHDNHCRSGWIRCGGGLPGLSSKNVEVRWDV